MTGAERHLLAEVERRRDDLVALASELIAFDTTAREPGDAPREEAALQERLAARLGAVGAEVELWEPRREEVAGSPLVPPGLGFDGRPQLVARLASRGGGPSLLLNGHVDVVSVEPRGAWSSDPFQAEVRDGRLHGRGAADMKGGVAAAVVAVEALASLGGLGGDLLLCTVTDEESTGAGAVAAVAHGVRADAAIVAEPSDLAVWIGARGSLHPTVVVPGRSGHAGRPHPDWRRGGAVNAIDKALLVHRAIRRFERAWQEREQQRDPRFSPGHIAPTLISGGEWIVSHPATCRLVYHLAYPPSDADERGWGSEIARELEDAVAAAARDDPWLAEHPPVVEWSLEAPPFLVPADAPIVGDAAAAARAVGWPGHVAGTDSWFDAATFTLAGTPCVGFGPGDSRLSHTTDEHVEVESLVAGAQALALTALRFCGAAG
jgi:acetylornithine deacetylase